MLIKLKLYVNSILFYTLIKLPTVTIHYNFISYYQYIQVKSIFKMQQNYYILLI